MGVLIGLIWHIHIALLLILSAIPVAILLAGKLPNLSQIMKTLLTFFVTSLPFMVFELKHGFQQTINLLNNFTTTREGAATGWYKFQTVVEMITKNINSLFFAPQSFEIMNNFLFPLAILISALLLVKIRLIKLKELIPLYVWIFTVILFFSISSAPISEYYFANIEVIFLGIVAFYLYFFYKSSTYGKYFVIGLISNYCF